MNLWPGSQQFLLGDLVQWHRGRPVSSDRALQKVGYGTFEVIAMTEQLIKAPGSKTAHLRWLTLRRQGGKVVMHEGTSQPIKFEAEWFVVVYRPQD